MLNRTRRLVIVAAVALAGCADSRQLYIASRTVVGVNAAVNATQTAGHLLIGYDRVFVTNPPKSVTVPGKDGEREAMSVLSCSELVVDGIFLTGFREHLATGKAAIDFAAKIKDDATAANDFFNCATPAK